MFFLCTQINHSPFTPASLLSFILSYKAVLHVFFLPYVLSHRLHYYLYNYFATTYTCTYICTIIYTIILLEERGSRSNEKGATSI